MTNFLNLILDSKLVTRKIEKTVERVLEDEYGVAVKVTLYDTGIMSDDNDIVLNLSGHIRANKKDIISKLNSK